MIIFPLFCSSDIIIDYWTSPEI